MFDFHYHKLAFEDGIFAKNFGWTIGKRRTNSDRGTDVKEVGFWSGNIAGKVEKTCSDFSVPSDKRLLPRQASGE